MMIVFRVSISKYQNVQAGHTNKMKINGNYFLIYDYDEKQFSCHNKELYLCESLMN
jgi:hypothetical protein